MTFDEWWDGNYDRDLSECGYAQAAWDASITAERERCAKLCEQIVDDCDSWEEEEGGNGGRVAAGLCAKAIARVNV